MTEKETRLELSRAIVRRQTKIREDLIDTYLSACGVPALIRYNNGQWGRTDKFLEDATQEILNQTR